MSSFLKLKNVLLALIFIAVIPMNAEIDLWSASDDEKLRTTNEIAGVVHDVRMNIESTISAAKNGVKTIPIAQLREYKIKQSKALIT